jgi:hypothetical protein
MLEGFRALIGTSLLGFFAVAPSSTNFTLKAYEFGTGGGGGSSASYNLQSVSGEQSLNGSSTNYALLGGLIGSEQANVPAAPTFTNPSNEYNRLRLVINTSGNPTDTRYEVAISTDSFATTQYVQTDFTVGSTDTIAQYQTASSWGGVSGVWIVGLQPSTTYQVKVRALQGQFTGSAFGPVATAATVAPSLTFSVATSLSGTPPFTLGFSDLGAGTVVTAPATAELGLSTNSVNGGVVYVRSSGSLSSTLAGYGIPSATADLGAVATGYGALVASTSQTSGGPMTAVAPYSGTGSNVGALGTSLQAILTTSSAVTGGTGSVSLKAKAEATTPASTDYTDTITFVASMLY